MDCNGNWNRGKMGVFWISPEAKLVNSQLLTVAVSPKVRVLDGQISSTNLDLLRRWVEINRNVTEKHWTGEIAYSADAIEAVRGV